MRALVVSIWVFINLVFFGMCGYMYLLWSQYWMFMERQSGPTTSTYDQQIYYYNRGYITSDNRTHNSSDIKLRIKHSPRENVSVTLIKNSKPRFPNLQDKDIELDTKKFICHKNESRDVCVKKSGEFREKILKELRRVFEDEGNILKSGSENPYNVQYDGVRGNFLEKTAKEVACEIKNVEIKTLKRGDLSKLKKINEFLPRRGLFENRKFNSCAVVASSGALKDSNLGRTIDAHDLVLRFNNAPTKGFEEDVGKKTTIRVLNSQVVSKDAEYRFLRSDLYKNITIVAWDPSTYKASLDEWLEKPEFNLFPNFVEYRKRNDKARIFLLNPHSLWELWDFLQANSPTRLRRNPPSSGFLGLSLLLPLCNFVDIFEYVPSTRVTKRCHYYDPEDNPACTFGVWHPLAAEKLLSYHMNIADDFTVFQTGYIRIPGTRNLQC